MPRSGTGTHLPLSGALASDHAAESVRFGAQDPSFGAHNPRLACKADGRPFVVKNLRVDHLRRRRSSLRKRWF
jgi:hypothetical protein